MDALDRVAGPALDLLTKVDDALAHWGAPPHHRVWPLMRQVRALPGEAVAAFVETRPDPTGAAASALRARLPGYADAAEALTARPDWTGAAAAAYDAKRLALGADLVGTDRSAAGGAAVGWSGSGVGWSGSGVGWSGSGVGWTADGGVGGGADPHSIAGRLAATADFGAQIARWVELSRAALATTLADALASPEAVTLVTATSSAGPTSVEVPGVDGAGSGPTSTSAGSTSAGPTPVAAATIAASVLTVLLEIVEHGEDLLSSWQQRQTSPPRHVVDPDPVRFDGVTRLRY
ncbi:hypothetical protein O7632_04680 [Solwaraspora sp. WMMD406]|uniref:hypothetical protein n=1 Tax=Solwaraspora sp. WMMD406 TaxID=3016095 RepID=UPI0024166F0B|nr:hypothetical protein [Solwaraspora sp. WMMD406]MDG4763407.1 hypothetical protein [Solwaraspora sp. WMMD406]